MLGSMRFLFAAALLVGTSSALAHPHTVTAGDRVQELANGQNHPGFTPGTGTSCDTLGLGDPAWYGLETAHHGPEWGDPGKDDECYITTDNVPPGQDVQNPVIH